MITPPLKSEGGKWFLLEFMCDIEHIPGVDNIVADGLSRLIPDETTSSTIPIILAAMRPFEPETEEDHLYCSFWHDDSHDDI